MALLMAVCAAGARATDIRIGDVAPSYDVDVRIDLAAGTWEGTETVRFTHRRRMPAREVVFNLYPNAGARSTGERLLEISTATINGVACSARYSGGEVRVLAPEPIRRGTAVEVALGFRGRAVRLEPDDMDLSAHVNDQVTVILNGTERRRIQPGRTTTVSADAMLLGNPFPVLAPPGSGLGRDEWRAGDVVTAEAAAWRVRVTAPDGVDVIASGNRTASPSPEVTVFEGEGLRTIGVFASRGYAQTRATAAGVRLAGVFSKAHAPAARRALEAMRGSVEFYAETFGAAPVRELALVEAPLAPGTSSVSFTGLIAVASAYASDVRGAENARLPGYIRDTPELIEGEIEFVTMHESARQWWGELVGSDPQQAAFLDEGPAIYAAVMSLEALRGRTAAAQAVEQRLRAPYRVYRMFGGVDAPANRRANDFPNWFAYMAIVETKGALLLGAVRARLGDARFVEGLRRYAEAHAGGIARPDDLREALQPRDDEAARKDVERLFQRWLEQRHGDEDIGEPEYAVGVTPDVAKKKDRGPGSPFEWFGRLIVRKLVQVGKATAKPF